MKERALSWTLEITHIFSELSGQFCSHSVLITKKEKEMEEQFTKRMAEREREKSDSFVCQNPLNAVVW